MKLTWTVTLGDRQRHREEEEEQGFLPLSGGSRSPVQGCDAVSKTETLRAPSAETAAVLRWASARTAGPVARRARERKGEGRGISRPVGWAVKVPARTLAGRNGLFFFQGISRGFSISNTC